MTQQRKEYMKPLVTRLEYMADAKVSMSNGCKTSGTSGTGVSNICDTASGCTTSS